MSLSEADKISYKNTYARILRETQERKSAIQNMLAMDGWDDEERQGLAAAIVECSESIERCKTSSYMLDRRVYAQLALEL